MNTSWKILLIAACFLINACASSEVGPVDPITGEKIGQFDIKGPLAEHEYSVLIEKLGVANNSVVMANSFFASRVDTNMKAIGIIASFNLSQDAIAIGPQGVAVNRGNLLSIYHASTGEINATIPTNNTRCLVWEWRPETKTVSAISDTALTFYSAATGVEIGRASIKISTPTCAAWSDWGILIGGQGEILRYISKTNQRLKTLPETGPVHNIVADAAGNFFIEMTSGIYVYSTPNDSVWKVITPVGGDQNVSISFNVTLKLLTLTHQYAVDIDGKGRIISFYQLLGNKTLVRVGELTGIGNFAPYSTAWSTSGYELYVGGYKAGKSVLQRYRLVQKIATKQSATSQLAGEILL